MEQAYGPIANEDQVREYERRRYRGLDQRVVDYLEWRCISRLLDRVVVRGSTVVDVPCGYGRFTLRLAARGALVFGVDISDRMVARTRERWRPGVPGAAADVTTLPFANDSVEGAVVMRLLHHLEDSERQRALNEIARVISEWAVLSAYTVAPLHRLVRRVQGRPPKEAAMSLLRKQIESAGLEILETRALLPYLHAQHMFLVRPGPD